MTNYLLAKSIKTSAALARIGQGYSPLRRQIIVRQNKGGVRFSNKNFIPKDEIFEKALI